MKNLLGAALGILTTCYAIQSKAIEKGTFSKFDIGYRNTVLFPRSAKVFESNFRDQVRTLAKWSSVTFDILVRRTQTRDSIVSMVSQAKIDSERKYKVSLDLVKSSAASGSKAKNRMSFYVSKKDKTVTGYCIAVFRSATCDIVFRAVWKAKDRDGHGMVGVALDSILAGLK